MWSATMLETRIRAYQSAIRTFDIISAIVAFIACIAIISAWPILLADSGLYFLNIRLFAVFILSIILILIVHFGFFAFFGMLHGIYDLSSIRKHLARSIFVLSIDCLCFYALQLALSTSFFPVSFYAYYISIAFLLNILFNALSRLVIKHFISRFSVRPGITCYWQSLPNRNDVAFTDWMNLDMQYISDWNLLVDLKIIIKTIPVVLSGTGR
jgi:hypothetical protein